MPKFDPFTQFIIQPPLFQSAVEIRSAADGLVVLNTHQTLLIVQLAGLFLIGQRKVAMFLKELPQPVIGITVVINGVTDCFRKIGGNRPFRSRHDPLHDGGTYVIHEVIGIIFDVAFLRDFCIEGKKDELAPDAVIVSANLRQMVGIQYQRMK